MRGLVNHVDLTVKDPVASRPFYEAVLGHMGYRALEPHARGIDFDLTTPEGVFASVGIMKASEDGAARPHDRYSPGLHHIAWSAADRTDVDALYELLIGIGAEILDAPAEYPRYGNGYYAVFFADPDGLKLEYVHWPK